jgi:hypothetical protein
MMWFWRWLALIPAWRSFVTPATLSTDNGKPLGPVLNSQRGTL